MYTDHLKKYLAMIAARKMRVESLDAEFASHPSKYACMTGALQAIATGMADDAASALRWLTDHIEPIEREHDRFIAIFDALDVDLDEDTLATLELIGQRTWDNDRSERYNIADVIRRVVGEVQESERESEHDQATDALIAAGFVHDEENDCFDRADQRVTITLANGRESRYTWELESNASGDQLDSGKSGDFSRLLALIAPKSQEVKQ